VILGSVVDFLEATRLGASLFRQHRRDGSGQRRLAMVDMTDGPDVDVRLVALEFLLRHFLLAPVSTLRSPPWANRGNLSECSLR
jgi:hypothetical protein